MIETPLELYAYAVALEREAAARYAELAERMSAAGRSELAALFRRLAGFEAEHLAALERRTAGSTLPALGAHAGLPETAPAWICGDEITPRQALQLALDGERRAHAFFERVSLTAPDAALRALAREMMAEEAEHAGMLRAALARLPEGVVAWSAVFDART